MGKDTSEPRLKNQKSKINPTGLLVKILLISLISLFLASLAAFITLEVLNSTGLFGLQLSNNGEDNLLLIAFSGTFCISFILMNFAYKTPRLPIREKQIPEQKQKQEEGSLQPIKPNKRQLRQHLSNVMAGSKDFVIEETETKDNKNSSKNKDLIDSPSINDESKKSTKPLSPDVENQNSVLPNFLLEALAQSKDPKEISNFDKFGINLFLAGASEALIGEGILDEPSRGEILANSIESLGLKKSHASVFVEKYQEYLLQDPCYLQMYQSGRNGMITHLKDQKSAAKQLELALENWNLPKSKLRKTGPVTILTSNIRIPPSTEQASGVSPAQVINQIHNRIIRNALKIQKGREIKHAGKGIVAAFEQVSNSVDAAIQIQRETLAYNKTNPKMQLDMKIGIDTGEPRIEGNDLFSRVTQVSASIVAQAQQGQIFVSENIRGSCRGRGYNFAPKGNYEIKGYQGSLPIYEVLW